jgi:uncharacterized protein DUF4148
MPLRFVEELTMKLIARMVLCAVAGTAYATYAFAQTPAPPHDPSTPKTRAEVVAEIAAWQAAGFEPDDWIDYPENAIAASRIVAERSAAGTVSQARQ